MSSSKTLRGKEIIKSGFRVQVFLQSEHPFVFNKVSYFALRIEQVPEFPGSRGTGFHAGGVTPIPDPLDTKRAFFHNIFHSRPVPQIMDIRIQFFNWNVGLSPVKDPSFIRTGRDTITAAYAPVVIDNYDTVRFLPRRLDGTDAYTGGIFALLALNRHVHEPRFRHCFGIVVVLRILQVDQAPLLQADDSYPLELRVDPGLVVFFHTGVNASSATYTSRQVQAVAPESPRLGRPCADPEFLLVFSKIHLLQPPDDLLLFFFRHFPEAFLEKLFHLGLGARRASQGKSGHGAQGHHLHEFSSGMRSIFHVFVPVWLVVVPVSVV